MAETRTRRSAWLMLWVAAMLPAAAAMAISDRAWAAGSAYQVDTGVISSPGSCKVDSWVSSAANKDFFVALAPTCVVDLYRPFEFSAQFSRFRSDDEWTTAVLPKVKTNIVPGGAVGEWSVALAATAAYDASARELAAFNFVVPATLRMTDNIRINLNAAICAR